MGSRIAKILGLSTTQEDDVEKVTGRLKSVAEFLKDAVDALKDASTLQKIADAVPWHLTAVTGALAEAAPPIKFIAALLDKAVQIRDPDQLAFLACTTAFQRASEKSIAEADAARKPPRGSWVPAREIPGPDEGMRFATFSILEPSQHDFFRQADALLGDALTALGLDGDAARRIRNDVRTRFPGELKALIHHPKTRERFLAFADALRFSNVEERTRAAWLDHFDYQRFLYEDKRVFGEEPFSLADVYVNTECGVLTFREIQEGIGGNQTGVSKAPIRLDPFSETMGGREDMLTRVLEFIGDKTFHDAIVIQGPAGAGKSAFTLRLGMDLLRRGLRPIRIRFRDLPLQFPNIEDALPEAVRFWDPETTARDAPHARPEELFKYPDIFSESVEFEGAKICPWVLILDGWDEVSVAADKGFSVRMAEILGQVRDRYLNRPNRPPIRVILTGRPSDVLAEKGVLKKDTKVLTIRPLRPEILAPYIYKLANVLVEERHPERARSDRFKPVLDSYRRAFEAYAAPSGGSTRTGFAMEVLGLPLLAHLAARLMVRWPESDLLPLVENPTTLYRQLTDMTCQLGGRYGRDAFEPVLASADMRALLHETAFAMTVFGQDSIPYEELDLRLSAQNEDLLDRVQTATFDAPLTSLLISYFFKGGRKELGAEFVHKSFREFLFAEGLVQSLKRWGVADERQFAELSSADYWRDFDSGDPRFGLSRKLASLLAPHWMSQEVAKHVASLIEWEIGRSHQGGASGVSLGAALPAVDVAAWRRVRDGLADLWDWWGEGVHLRDQPVRKGRIIDRWESAYVHELGREATPKTKTEFRAAPRSTALDAHLGDGLCRLAALVHHNLAQRPGENPNWDNDLTPPESLVARRYQSIAWLNGRWEWRFKPSGDHPSYFANYISRINAAGWRPGGYFPQNVSLKSIDLSGASLSMLALGPCDFTAADLSDAELIGSQLFRANLTQADLRRSSLVLAQVPGATVTKANFTDAQVNAPESGVFSFFDDFLKPRGLDEAIGLPVGAFRSAELRAFFRRGTKSQTDSGAKVQSTTSPSTAPQEPGQDE
jgi:Pentapeptide repeats (8 copies)